MKMKKLLVFLLICILTVCGFRSSNIAKAGTTYLDIDSSFSRTINAEPGTTVHVKMPVSAITQAVNNPVLDTVYESTAPFTTGAVTLTQSNQETTLIAIYDYSYVEFDINVKENARMGSYDLGVEFLFDVDNEDGEDEQVDETHTLKVRVTNEKEPAQLSISEVTYDEEEAAVGSAFDVSFTVTNEGEIAAETAYYSIDYGNTDIVPDYSVEKMKLSDLTAGKSENVTLAMKALTTADEGLNTLTVNFTYKDEDGNEFTDSKKLYITLKDSSIASTDDASLVFGNNTLNQEVESGEEFNINGTIKNIGNKNATDIQLTIEDGTGVSSQILKNYNTDSIKVKNMKAGSSTSFSIPLKVSKSAGPGLQEITVQLEYEDGAGKTHTVIEKHYITILNSGEEGDDTVCITNISQSPAYPSEGGVVNVTFTLENNSEKAITDVDITANNLSVSGLNPNSPDPEVNIGTLGAGKKKNITMQFTVQDNVSQSSASFTLVCSYKDSSNKKNSFNKTVYVLNLPEEENDNSKPKLIISSYSTDEEELKAGSEFQLTFGLENTNNLKAAKNIKITVTQDDDIFTVSKGSDSIYVERINPGETVENTLTMKVKSDAETGSYDLDVEVEYEYDDMSDMDADNGGITETNTISLQAVEDAQAVIENISLGDWGEEPTVNKATGLGFEFYNMGQSTLENVYFTFEGDFQLETGDMSYLGTVEPGTSEYVEPMVIPLVEGNASGTIVVHYEDSTGNEFTINKEIPVTSIQSAEMTEDKDTIEDIPVMSGDTVVTKKSGIPFEFIIVLIIAFIAFILLVHFIIKRMQLSKHDKDLSSVDKELKK